MQRKRKARSTALKDLIDDALDPGWKRRGRGGRRRRRGRARRGETCRDDVVGRWESLKKEDAEPNALNGDGQVLQAIVFLVRKKLNDDTGGPRGRDPPFRFTMGVALSLLEPGRYHRKSEGEWRVRNHEGGRMGVLLHWGTPPIPTSGRTSGLTIYQGGSGPPVPN